EEIFYSLFFLAEYKTQLILLIITNIISKGIHKNLGIIINIINPITQIIIEYIKYLRNSFK
ncbi:hypothetical protein ACV3P1_16545, partial [Clostridium perfringens]